MEERLRRRGRVRVSRKNTRRTKVEKEVERARVRE